ncbi:hydrogen peroxide-inducible genes activator [Novosphingobium taihuense]|uniref:LysR family hydrogen peroxide-inducible transcriptional activator n=1 Tax=Novosphingobium taihuense TaxID=260085 RepID=A0A7W7AE40_9SPHN|nr:hydrogen peroxide-inducible genes activator [Novosphingobium taihuense]MBB4615339.1 LysR family hydrogen peroxide-inducible transcriptional activator [Novosphingobium taihuense]TWH84374.1 transcriptional regulator, LysR family [Novosphingobium taihuense]
MLSFRQLQYLVAIADYQHFRRAAANLHVSQPTLSLQVQKMEEHLGVILIERGVTPARLTPVGREIVARARRLLLDLTDLEDCARRSAGKLIGTISLGVSPTIGPYLLPGIVGVLKRQMPQVRLHIREGIPSEHMHELRHGALDILLTPVPVVGGDLHVETLFEERLQVVAPPEHPLSGKRRVTRADLAGSEALGIDPRYPFHNQTQDICDDLGLDLLSDYEGTSLDSLCQMCASGLGLAVLPELYLRSEVGGRNIVTPLQIHDWSARRSIAAVWRAGSVYTESFHEIAMAIQREALLLLKDVCEAE